MWKRGRYQQQQQVRPEVVPLMDKGTMQRAVENAAGGTALALIQYTDDKFELVSGNWNVQMEENGYISYWVGERLVAMLGSTGVPETVPSLRSLQVGYIYPLHELTTEVMPEFRAAS